MTDLATQRQVSAADPAHSVWLSANAGSGKTKVLTDRVARLLLDGTEPQKILCLTYTKAAASEMQNRLLKRLGEWAMFDDARLRAELTRLGGAGEAAEAVPAERLAQARRLFAKAIETPGGLKIQTIHSFCGMLLRRFPLEAGVPHGFAELDDRSAAEMRSRIVEEIAESPERTVLDRLADCTAGEDLSPLIAEVSRHAATLARPVTRADLLSALGQPADLTRAGLPALVFDGSEKALFDTVIPILKAESKTMKDLAAVLARVDLKAPTLRDVEELQSALLRKIDWTLSSKIPTKKAAEAMGEDTLDDFKAFAERLSAAKDSEFALAVAARSEALSAFARAFVPRYRARKAAGGWLDFDDLIERAGALLSRGSVAQWVLFRLDGGIDHILVDEAQDTSPGQWQVIERLADEFTAGEGAREAARTIFVVGDRKQSIYSFQGADLHRFEAMRALFTEKFAAIERPLRSDVLQHSFRSAPAVLQLVDETFAGAGAVGLGGAPEHIAFHRAMPGRVDLWPAIARPEDAPEGEWDDPVDLPGREDADVILARTIAAEIRAMIEGGQRLPDGKGGSRPLDEGDFLILVQRRAFLFGEIIRACKAAGLAVAGADRLRLGAEIAVKDIVSLLTFLATPEDDLSLAEALRSPLFGWTEAELYALAQPRKGYLWPALRERGPEDPNVAIIQDLLGQTDFLRPFDLIARILNRHGGRGRLIARLGPEAEDGIDELVQQALAYEMTEIPSLTGFLGWLGADDIEVKRQMENEGRTIRVMTVHGSKGLESPVVILPDTAKPHRSPAGSSVFETAADQAPAVALWKGGPMPAALRTLSEDEATRIREEKMRLLYVALTRAESWLIVAAAGETGEGEESWYALVEGAMARLGAGEAEGISPRLREIGVLRRHASGDWPEPAGAEAGTEESAAPELPGWLFTRPEAPPRPEATLSPSDLGGAKALPGEDTAEGPDEATALRRGRQLHLLLEHLPTEAPEARAERARALLSTGPDRTEDIAPLLATAERVIAAIAASGFDLAASLAEVEVTAAPDALQGRVLRGAIDRLWVTPAKIHVLDYKSNRVVPGTAAEVPLGIVRQLAAYRAMLAGIYPGREIACTVVWTETATLTELPAAQMEEALSGL
ncbi:double-strand break repair helicase AddA [Paenirhodobacter enshiensis]|uniref:double-strand break repair helicase AddA n=1 Tax=Paenirhodobacter enshiensis TaxID=1105367 RepID=UPI0035B11CD7